ncbi:DUF547 domain-containing protein [Desulforhopalus singaporensis]|uniref:DUF547 domain-containing protein n=1 Tax=Desulforhopalus singaporensis TaxID=91360 RepID=A0A1H0L475_9BACT|nr:DUF547 domain-containing protein [Desulforhopalus singaporensis]SDO62862.1 Protein of unknown function, DUF547 [Desulforhopalus singaporensis]
MVKNLIVAAVLLFSAVADAQEFDHAVWDKLLRENVVVYRDGKVTRVDYRALAKRRHQLHLYLDQLAAVEKERFDTWDENEQLAFLINVYNSWTVELVLTRYPDLDSIKELGSLLRSPWKKKIIALFGGTYSLDDIEHGFIRGTDRYREVRIHFAVNCGSIGCPALRGEAYTGARLETQLEDATRLFLQDRDRNRLEDDVLKLSSLFKWYREDFAKGWQGYDSLAGFVANYRQDLGLSVQDARDLASGRLAVFFLEYDWRLNDLGR